MLHSHDQTYLKYSFTINLGSLDDDEKWEAFKKGMKSATKKTHDVQDMAINGLFVLRKGSSRDSRP